MVASDSRYFPRVVHRDKSRSRCQRFSAVPGLLEFISDQSAARDTFRDNIRKRNSSISFTSMGVNSNLDLANAQDGVCTYRLQGAVVHELGPLLSRPRRTKMLAAKECFPMFSKAFGYEISKQYWRGPSNFAVCTRIPEGVKQSMGLTRILRLR